MLNKKRNNKGFTLVELLVVIAIIGILAVVAVPALFKNIEKGKVAELESDISALRSATLSYYSEKSSYPFDGTKDDKKNVILVPGQKPSDSDLATDKDGSKSILSEVESLGFPFKGSYEFGLEEAPNALSLTIKPDDKSKLSNSAIEKLQNDLGQENVDIATIPNPDYKPEEDRPQDYDPNTPETVPSDDGSIVITLIKSN